MLSATRHGPVTQSLPLFRQGGKTKRAPLLGEHKEFVSEHILGMSDEEIAKLVMEGVIE